MHPSETFPDTEIDTPTSNPEADNITLDDETKNGSMTEPESIGSVKIIRCKKREYGADCMGRCAEEAGISCQGGRRHPYKDNVKPGLLGQCRSVGVISSCWYYYKNGDVCRFVGGAPVLCRYEGGNP
ncbi:hypothetical protein [Sorangium sp. So ce406]|uniref:hypothetical protein n=1 Tax=Sorangium sp. So ce406 TaxID=3133311 RepID=UPI003F5C6A61